MSLVANVNMCLGQVVNGEPARDNAILIGVFHKGDINDLFNMKGFANNSCLDVCKHLVETSHGYER